MAFTCEHGTTYLEAFDAQKYCEVSAGTLSRWRREGWVQPAFQIGNGSWIYTKELLDQGLYNVGYTRQDTTVTVIERN